MYSKLIIKPQKQNEDVHKFENKMNQKSEQDMQKQKQTITDLKNISINIYLSNPKSPIFMKTSKQSIIPNRRTTANVYQTNDGKMGESYGSYFFRASAQKPDCSPARSSLTNNTDKTKSRAKDQKSKTGSNNDIQSELQLTQKNLIDKLSEENSRLRQTITELTLATMYQINEDKVKDMLTDIENLRKQLKILQRDNENLKIQNDFLSRTNQQLKIQISKTQLTKEDLKLSCAPLRKSLDKVSIMVSKPKYQDMIASIDKQQKQKQKQKYEDYYCTYDIPQDERKLKRRDILQKYILKRREKEGSLKKTKSEKIFQFGYEQGFE